MAPDGEGKGAADMRLLTALLVALALALGPGTAAEAKYGECPTFYVGYWKATGGKIGFSWLVSKIQHNCDPEDGGWRAA